MMRSRSVAIEDSRIVAMVGSRDAEPGGALEGSGGVKQKCGNRR